jgi:hypothetical protein
VVNVLEIKLGYACDIFIPIIQCQEKISWKSNLDDHSESSIAYDMIAGNEPWSSWRIRHNHEILYRRIQTHIQTP